MALFSHICSERRLIFSHNNDSEKLSHFPYCESRDTTVNYRYFHWGLVSKMGIVPSPLQVDFQSFSGRGSNFFRLRWDFIVVNFQFLKKCTLQSEN